MKMRKVLVAVDDSETSRELARFVHDFFGDESVEILGVNVATRPPQWIAPGIGYGAVFPAFPMVTANGELSADVELRNDARDQAAQVLGESGLDTAAPIGAIGDPVVAIMAAAAEHDVDLIAVGGDDGGFLDRIMDRSVARVLLSEAGRPILVVPPPEPASASGATTDRRATSR